MRFSINAILSFILLAIVLAIICVLLITLRQSQKITDTSERVSHTRDLISDVQKILLGVLDNETGFRGYLLTGNRDFLEPLLVSENELVKDLDTLRQRLTGNESQQIYFDSLSHYVNLRIRYSTEMVQLSQQDPEQATARVRSGLGKFYTDQVRHYGKLIQDKESGQLTGREAANADSISTLNYILYGVLATGLVLSFLIVQRIRTDFRKQRENEMKFMALLDSAPDATVIVDRKGTIQIVNNQTEALFGYTRTELVGQPVETLIPVDLRKEHVHHRDGYVKEPRVRAMGLGIELHAVKKNGASFPVEISLSPIETDQGLLISASVRDITVRKELENELKRSNAEMEAFTYSVSHDLRAPLRGIIGFTAILEEDYTSKLDDEARRVTSVIKTNTMRMGHLIDDLLAFSRLGKQELTKSSIDMKAMVKEVIAELDPPERGISWKIGELPAVQADWSTLRQVWINLISNAIKYSGKKINPRIEIESYHRKGQLVFCIKDNGVGFDQKYAHKLFHVFQRLHSTEEFEGTGVGLALVEKIISRHGGRVWAEGKEEEGALFYFSLPDGS